MANLYPSLTDLVAAEVELDKFGPGKHGFTGGDPQANPPKLRTRVRASWTNGVTREIMAAIEGSGQVPDSALDDQLWQAIRPCAAGIYGTGEDQPFGLEEVVIDGEAMLDQDLHARRLRITSTGHLRTDGWRLYVSELLVIEEGGLISHDGERGADGTDGSAPGAGAIGGALRTLAGGAAGGSGSVGPGVDGNAPNFSAGGNGGSGGTTGNNLGGAGGLVSPPPPQAGSWKTLWPCLRGRVEGCGATGWIAGGGGGGGGSGVNLVAGGGGGGGGGVVLIAAQRVDIRGEIRAAGGAGGNGQGIAAGGGGGGGGVVLLTFRWWLGPKGAGLIHAPGGAGGGSEGGGQSGANGKAGRRLMMVG